MRRRYTCVECGKSFDNPMTWEENHGFSSPPYEAWSGCPFCGGDYADTIICDWCGKPISGRYVEVGTMEKCYCESCFTVKDFGVYGA